MVNGPIHHNLLQPRPKRTLPPKRVDMTEGIDKSFLQYIFSFGLVIHNPQADVIHRLYVLLIEVILRPSLTLLAAFDQFSMTVWVRRSDVSVRFQQVQRLGMV